MSMMTSGSTNLQSLRQSCYNEWLNLQDEDLLEQLKSLNVLEGRNEDEQKVFLKKLIEKSIGHYQDYADQRALMASDHVYSYFASNNLSSFLETTLLWLGGCRPSTFIRLAYALTGLHTEGMIRELLEKGHVNSDGDKLSLSGPQLILLDGFHGITIKDEDMLSSAMASLQELMSDIPFVAIAKEVNLSCIEESEVAAGDALIEHEKSMVFLLQQADKLRIKTLKELMNILNPAQGIEFLICEKKLRLCIHQWGRRRDLMQGTIAIVGCSCRF